MEFWNSASKQGKKKKQMKNKKQEESKQMSNVAF